MSATCFSYVIPDVCYRESTIFDSTVFSGYPIKTFGYDREGALGMTGGGFGYDGGAFGYDRGSFGYDGGSFGPDNGGMGTVRLWCRVRA